jgi:preprotein translocase subunit SecE
MKLITMTHTYFREAIAELKKVVWPTQKQTVRYSIVVIAMTVGVVIFFGFLDYIFSNILGLII